MSERKTRQFEREGAKGVVRGRRREERDKQDSVTPDEGERYDESEEPGEDEENERGIC